MLIDTHYAFALAGAPSQLRASEWELLRAQKKLHVSAVSIWEMRLKWSALYRSGARKGPIDPARALDVLVRLGLTMLPLAATHAATVLQQSIAHSDPFDELLLAQAQSEGLKLFTRDRLLRDHPLAVTV